MDRAYPIYTVETECQDCYKCLRECPVKAIKVEKGHANVIPDLCVCCGHCVQACPAHAKKVRDDLPRAKYLIESGRKVYVSLAPSWVSEFRGMDYRKIITAFKKLGVAGVGETAHGAQAVSAEVAKLLKNNDFGVHLSTACPAFVSLVEKHIPQYAENLTKLMSPVLAHCLMLRKRFGDDIAVIMVGPCIAKKTEADKHPQILNLALTFQDFRRWLEENRINLETLRADPDADFVDSRAEEGALYPIEGGMIQTIKAYKGTEKARTVTLSGVSSITETLRALNPGDISEAVFVEALACQGGCINGPCCENKDACITGRVRVEGYAKEPKLPLKRNYKIVIADEHKAEKGHGNEFAEESIQEALAVAGKLHKEDELNCGGCGYESCRRFAIAMLEGKAETEMCVSYLRKQAQKKANALLRCMPAGVVIVDSALRIIECNQMFAAMFDEGTRQAYEVCPGLQGALVEKIVPFGNYFRKVLKTERDIHRDACKIGKRLYSVTVFSIEPHKTAGAVIFDTTRTELKREQIALKAQEVINKNIAAVQEIACLLGEHVADTEILLRSIAEDYQEEKKERELGE